MRQCRRQGISTIYMVVIMVALAGFVSLATDYAHVQLAKGQLETATDAACRFSTKYAINGATFCLTKANQSTAENPVNGSALVLQAGDLKVGNWSAVSKTFTNGGLPINAVKIDAQRSSARGNAIPLLFGAVIGRGTCDIRSTCVCSYVNYGGFQAMSGMTFKNNTDVYGYDPNTLPRPTTSSASATGSIGSNGYIGEMHNGNIQGTACIGPSGSIDPGFTVTSGTNQISTPIPTPSLPTMFTGPNPGGVPQNYTHNSASPLQAGSYYFTSLTLNAAMKFNGPATLYVNGDIIQLGDFNAYSWIPSNLKIYVYGTRTWAIGSNSSGNNITAQVVAPYTALTGINNCTFYGTFIFDTVYLKNNCDIFVDNTNVSYTIVKLLQ